MNLITQILLTRVIFYDKIIFSGQRKGCLFLFFRHTCAYFLGYFPLVKITITANLSSRAVCLPLICHPEIADIIRRLRAFLRDLLFGALNGLDFCKWISLPCVKGGGPQSGGGIDLPLHAPKFAKGSKKEIPQVDFATSSNARDFGMTSPNLHIFLYTQKATLRKFLGWLKYLLILH